MKKIVVLFGIVILSLCLLSCMSVSAFSKIQEGMTKARVIEIVGQPTSKGNIDGNEVFYYNNVYLLTPAGGAYVTYFVEFSGGKVVSYGQTGNVRQIQPIYITPYRHY